MKAERPFLHFLAKPFLSISQSDLDILQKKYIELNRRLHPDKVSQLAEVERQRCESLLSEINADFQCLKDSISLVDKVLTGAELPASGKESKIPPSLAGKYFEAQEIAEDEGEDSPAFQNSLKNLVNQASKLYSDSLSTFQASIQQFPFSGFVNLESDYSQIEVPWTTDHLLKLRALRQEMKYYSSFIHDIEEKYKVHAHTN